jgi:hypothetical protein
MGFSPRSDQATIFVPVPLLVKLKQSFAAFERLRDLRDSTSS